MLEKAALDDLELASMIIGGACHDHEHPGVNNVFMMESRADLAIRYNDVSVLENHHAASSFEVLKMHNFCENLDR